MSRLEKFNSIYWLVTDGVIPIDSLKLSMIFDLTSSVSPQTGPSWRTRWVAAASWVQSSSSSALFASENRIYSESRTRNLPSQSFSAVLSAPARARVRSWRPGCKKIIISFIFITEKSLFWTCWYVWRYSFICIRDIAQNSIWMQLITNVNLISRLSNLLMAWAWAATCSASLNSCFTSSLGSWDSTASWGSMISWGCW